MDAAGSARGHLGRRKILGVYLPTEESEKGKA